DDTGQAVGDYTALAHRLEEADRARAEAERKIRAEVEARENAEKARTDAERKAREAAEAREKAERAVADERERAIRETREVVLEVGEMVLGAPDEATVAALEKLDLGALRELRQRVLEVGSWSELLAS